MAKVKISKVEPKENELEATKIIEKDLGKVKAIEKGNKTKTTTKATKAKTTTTRKATTKKAKEEEIEK